MTKEVLQSMCERTFTETHQHFFTSDECMENERLFTELSKQLSIKNSFIGQVKKAVVEYPDEVLISSLETLFEEFTTGLLKDDEETASKLGTKAIGVVLNELMSKIKLGYEMVEIRVYEVHDPENRSINFYTENGELLRTTKMKGTQLSINGYKNVAGGE